MLLNHPKLLFLPAALFALLFASATNYADEPVRSKKAMIATVNPLATDAGIKAFQSGGNAVDAAIAAGLALGIVDSHNSGIGGGCFILIRTAKGDIYAIDGREMAPGAATRDMYLRDGKPDTRLSQLGALASGVPGALAAYDEALKLAGKKSLAVWLNQTASLGEKGFPVSRSHASAINSKAQQLSLFPASRKALLKPDGKNYVAGDILYRKDLARTYRNVAEQGLPWFYGGDFAKRVEAWMSQNEGIMTADDFANYKVKRRTPIQTTYRGYQVLGFPPPSSGGVHVAQILNILENFDDLKEQTEVNRVHLISESMKLAFADRAYWLGDADYAKVPRGLVDKGYAAELAKKIRIDKTTKVLSHGTPPNSKTDLFGKKHTTHLTAADSEGNWVAITQTINTTFGSKVVIPGTGVVMNNEMDDFSVAPGVANAFGLIGAEANSVAAGKRPLSSMSPTILLKDGKPVMTVGAAGGPKIITQSLLAIVRFVDLEQPIQQALAAPRFHHQWSPDTLLIENRMNEKTVKLLEAKGHRIRRSNVVGISQAIAIDSSGMFYGVHDPRVDGKAAGL